MASQGYISNQFRSGYKVQIEWNVNSQNTASNTSNVTVKAQLVSTGPSYNIIANATKQGRLTINGTAYGFTFNASLSGGQTKTVFTKTLDVTHSENGAKNISLALSLGIAVTLSGKYWGTVSTEGTADLNGITTNCIKHIVVKGDTLWGIAKKYGTTVDALVKLNNIPNRNLIYVGQVIYISGKPSGGGGGGSPAAPPNTVNVTMFGLQADTDRTIFAVWTWPRDNTDKYEVQWDYYTANDAWFTGSHTSVTHSENLESTYSAPANAKKVRFNVKPVSTTYKSGDNEVHHWTADFCKYYVYNMDDLPPKAPPVPTVEVEDYNLQCRLDNLDVNGKEIEFEVVKNDTSTFKMGTSTIITNSASHTFIVNAGDNYKVRARAKRDSLYSDWSNYSANISTKPSAPSKIISCKATSKTSIFLSWVPVESAETYEIEHAIKKEYFEGSNATTKITGIEAPQYEVTGLTMGERYFLRVRAKNAKGESSYTEPVSVVIGTKPDAPTTWSSTTTAIAGEPLKLYWVHNSEDKSKETIAEIEIYINETRITKTVENNRPEEEEQKTSEYIFDTSTLAEGAVLKWRVKTAGITLEFGDWSVQRTVNVFAPPTLSLELLTKDNNPLTVLESFPFYIKGIAGPSTQKPISFHTSIVSTSTYETVDEVGNVKMVIEGDEVYSKYHDINTDLLVKLMPGDVDLQNNVEYKVTCTVAMDSGLSTSQTTSFHVSWTDEVFTPNAEISLDSNTIATYIRPYCEYYPYLYHRVDYVNEQWVRTDVLLNRFEGMSVDNAFTQQGDIVYAGMYEGVLTHFCIVQSTTAVPIPDITLSVYRREFNGTFTEIGANLVNTDNTFVTDPHPSLDYARYRIVAISNATGSVSYTDLPAFPVGEKSIIIQWNETWSVFDVNKVNSIGDNAWSGSMLKLAYNIYVSDSNDSDVSLINYIGRAHPVSYYGTHVGTKATWNVDIPKYDKDTLYALRRLAIWMGDVYVREPSGSGYWANVSVSFNQDHKELIIPVTFDIVRVMGGV